VSGTRRLALVTAAGAWQTDGDAEPLVDALRRRSILAEPAVWDDPEVDWSHFDLVVLRSPWDYTERVEEFLAWAERVGAVTRLENSFEMLQWNTDKHYLAELDRVGLSVVPTSFISARLVGSTDAADIVARFPERGRFVVKPTVSSGSRNTTRYDSENHPGALAHVRRLLAEGRDVMVQPYVESVEERGETGMLFFGGVFSHGFRKGPLLSGGDADVDGLYAHEQIDPRVPEPDELQLARSVLAAVQARFDGATPLYARVDVLSGAHGAPLLLELEMTEPSYFFHTDPSSADRAAAAYVDRLAAAPVEPGRGPQYSDPP